MTYQSLKQRILEMPDEEQSRWRAYYSDSEWETSWELHAYPFQLPPRGHWNSWTIIGGRGVGKTLAGMKWSVDKFTDGHDVIGVFHHPQVLFHFFENMWKSIQQNHGFHSMEASIRQMERTAILRDHDTGKRLTFTAESSAPPSGGRYGYEYVWGDEVTDAGQIRQFFPLARQYVFTQPVKLDPDTIVSRAGEERA